jgi:D-lyxose ketol-isomerase
LVASKHDLTIELLLRVLSEINLDWGYPVTLSPVVLHGLVAEKDMVLRENLLLLIDLFL